MQRPNISLQSRFFILRKIESINEGCDDRLSSIDIISLKNKSAKIIRYYTLRWVDRNSIRFQFVVLFFNFKLIFFSFFDQEIYLTTTH